MKYTNLVPGQKYVVKGTLMDKSSGKALKAGGKKITAMAEFVPKTASGQTVVTFTFNASSWKKTTTTVVFEKLYVSTAAGTELVASHKDLKDKAQTVKFTKPPKSNPPIVKTGDSYAIYLFGGIAAIALLIGCFLLFKKKKK